MDEISDYDVFLSFRGPDTRHGIVDHLYESMTDKGIRVFKDDEAIRLGEEIGGELERSIRGSRIYVVVFSKDYASSAWCLRELAMIVGCCGDEAAGKFVLPIFYGVNPNDVKLRTDLYRNSLDKHRGKYGEEGVRRWEEALVKVAGICGLEYHLESRIAKDLGEGQFVGLVVRDVLNKLKIRDRRLPRHLIGIDAGVEGVMKLLNCDSPEVRVVMVHGVGGIGKTTLANVIFNRISSQFNGCSFLANVRESSAAKRDIAKLQERLLRDILGGPITEIGDSSDGMNEIQRRLGGKKVLIIFDDLSERSQLDELVGNCDFFGSGTRIIVTTRDRSVCKGLTGPCAVCTYEMEEMSEDHALQLFNRHAFGGESSPVIFADLSKLFVRTTGNLPLALEVIGGHLCGESKDMWERTLQQLMPVPDKVMKVLRISYDGLQDSQKQIFLDIACFSEKMPRRYASYMWEACGFYPDSIWGVDVLVNKSLVKVLNDGEFGMHDLIRDMGREIVRSEDLVCLGMRSRLWNPEEAMEVVRQKEGTNKVLAIDLGELHYKPHLACEEFEGMSNLRFLRLCGGELIGDFRNFRSKLMWLRLEDCYRGPNPAFFNMNKLVVLEISGFGITDESMEDWRMGNLRALYIGGSLFMTRMPDLSHCSKLERIILERCGKLETLHSSVGKLEKLMSLNINRCRSLRSLPEELGSAEALQELSLTGYFSFKELPESVGSLRDLRVLRVTGTGITKIPTSIGNLKCLEELNLDGCHHLRQLPELPGSLTKFTVESFFLQAFPDLSSLTNLTELVVDDSFMSRVSRRQPLQLPWLRKLHRLERLHLKVPVLLSTELGCLYRLQELILHSGDISSLSQLPSSLSSLELRYFGTAVPWVHYSNLESLYRLNLFGSTLTEIQLGGLDKLVNLTYLKISWCENLEKLSGLSCLRRLSSLRLGSCPKLVDISGIEKMEMLEELTIVLCDSLCRIPDLSCLTRLKTVGIFSCRSLLQVPCTSDTCYLNVRVKSNQIIGKHQKKKEKIEIAGGATDVDRDNTFV